jgi:Holliday junction resolvase RusA-like endonuclease
VLDACNGVLWSDDSAVSDLRVTKSIDKSRPGVDVEVWPIAARAKRLTKETSR